MEEKNRKGSVGGKSGKPEKKSVSSVAQVNDKDRQWIALLTSAEYGAAVAARQAQRRRQLLREKNEQLSCSDQEVLRRKEVKSGAHKIIY